MLNLNQLLAKLPEFEHAVKCGFQDLLNGIQKLYNSSARTSRILEQEYGVIPNDNTPAGIRYSARNLTQLPLIFDTYESPKATRQVLEFEKSNQNRLISRGYYSNLGDNPIRVVLLDQQGMPGTAHTLLPGTTINVSCYLSGMFLEPVTPGDEIKYQVLVQ